MHEQMHTYFFQTTQCQSIGIIMSYTVLLGISLAGRCQFNHYQVISFKKLDALLDAGCPADHKVGYMLLQYLWYANQV